MNSNREFAEPPKPGFFRKYGWYIVPIGFVLWGLAPHIKPFVGNALEKLVIMNKPESPEGDDVVASDDSLPEIVTFDEPSEPVEQKERSTLEILEEQNHKRIVEQGRSAGVSTEGSDIEILERINHERIVEQGRSAGVSTEGSDIEILERINHKRVVEQGKRAGVSTEGSDIEILERINHERIVEQAKRAGVSTDGTDIEILERISRKNLEKYN